MASLTFTCLVAAAAVYHVSVPAMQAIRTVEGGQERQEVCGNWDGSCDLGPFQVNDKAWVDTLANTLHADREVVRSTLRDDGCWNAQVASWILKQELDQAHGDLPTAIGNYHSHLPVEHYAYEQKVSSVLQSIDPDAPAPALPGSPGALKLPPDVADALPGLLRAGGEAPKGKLIRLHGKSSVATKSAGTDTQEGGSIESPGQDDNAAPASPAPDATPEAAPPAAAPESTGPVKIYRGGNS